MLTFTDIQLLRNTIENLINHLETFLPLANVHMVDYFTKNVYQTYIPSNIRTEIETLGFKKVLDRIFENDFKELPNLDNYSKKSEEFTLKNLNICLKLEEFQNKLSQYECKPTKLNKFMSTKKSHEVDILSYVAAAVKNITETSHLIDIGDGKGYLSSFLALYYNIPVLGVDASEINTTGSINRIKKLTKVCAEERDNHNCYKQITKYVDENVDFEQIVSNIFLKKPTGLGLIGLHTCGNLATVSLKIFTNNEIVRSICNVGCCYHLITEMDGSDNKSYGLPMSTFLKEKPFIIGRSARMIAAQPIERILNKKELPNETLFYRALLQVLLDKKCKNLQTEIGQVGRFKKVSENFLDYTRKALKRLNLDLEITDSEIQNLCLDYEERKYELYVFFMIRNMLSPVIESLILLDRLLYLQELGFEKSCLLQLFNPVVSPRCYGLIAIK